MVAIIVSQFQCRSNDANTFQVCARADAFEQTQYAFDIGPKILAELEQIVDQPYATNEMPKVTLAGVPSMRNGAMENWGKQFAILTTNLMHMQHSHTYNSRIDFDAFHSMDE